MLKRGNTDPIPSTYRLRLLACHAAIVRTNALLAQVILVRKVLGGFSHFEIIFTPGRTYHLFELRIVGPFSLMNRVSFIQLASADLDSTEPPSATVLMHTCRPGPRAVAALLTVARYPHANLAVYMGQT